MSEQLSEVTAYIKILNQKTPQYEDLRLPVSVRLDAEAAFKLEVLAQKFGLKKTTFATDILMRAIEEAWRVADQGPLEESGDLRRKYDAFTKAAIKANKKTKKPKKKSTKANTEDTEESNSDVLEEETEPTE